MYTYSQNGKNFVIDALTHADIESGELLAIDAFYYPPSAAWSKEVWTKLLNSVLSALAVREVTATGTTLIGNLVVSCASGKRSKVANDYSYYINSLTLHTDFLRQGHAKYLMKVFVTRLDEKRKVNILERTLENISVSLPRQSLMLSHIAGSYGFEAYEVDRKVVRYSCPIDGFIQKVMTKTSDLNISATVAKAPAASLPLTSAAVQAPTTPAAQLPVTEHVKFKLHG